jgi:SAM-dependent methyltransferase
VRWILKASAQKALSALPRGEDVNYLLQRHVAGSLPQRDGPFRQKVSRALRHFDTFVEYGYREPASAVFYEFGTGWDLVAPLAYYSLGVERQLLVDIRPSVKLELVNDAIGRYSRLQDEIEHEAGRPLRGLGAPDVRTIAALAERFGIDYRAPLDARRTGLAAESVDFVSSTNTLEHVPEPDIGAILAECRRLMRPDGVLSCRIDMRDHYSYFDRSLTVYHFLGLSDRRWRLANSSLHYQNRLRRPDYLRLFAEAGFEVVLENAVGPTPADLELLSRQELASRFRSYSLEDLGAKSLALVARPHGGTQKASG